MICPYYVPQCYAAQIEASALLGLRIGYTGLGVALAPFQRTRRQQQWYHRLFPLCTLVLGTHSGQNDQRWVFRLTVLGRTLGYLKAGPLTDLTLHSAQALGWSLR